eukprot:gene11224-135_t
MAAAIEREYCMFVEQTKRKRKVRVIYKLCDEDDDGKLSREEMVKFAIRYSKAMACGFGDVRKGIITKKAIIGPEEKKEATGNFSFF